jgi:hypothetical protein
MRKVRRPQLSIQVFQPRFTGQHARDVLLKDGQKQRIGINARFCKIDLSDALATEIFAQDGTGLVVAVSIGSANPVY